MSDQEYPLPPATFEFLVLSLKAQTEMHLGMYHFGDVAGKDRPEPDFRIARHSIDLLAMLQEKTRGNVTIEEQRLVENALTELRFRFVQAMESKAKKVGAEAESPTSQPEKTTSEQPNPEQPNKEEQAGG
jgi:heme-binding NEAT domain protein